MLVEFQILPIGGNKSVRNEIAEAVKIIDASGLNYQFTPTSTIIEGEWEEVMRVVKLCHDRVREKCPHVMTSINIEDEEGEQNMLSRNVLSVEQAIGRELKKTPEDRVA